MRRKGRGGEAREGEGWKGGDGMGWDGIMGSSRAQGRAGQGRAGRVCSERRRRRHVILIPGSSKRQVSWAAPHLSHAATGFRETMRSDAAVVGSFRPISIRVAPAAAVDRCSQCARGHAGSKAPQSRAKYLADPPSSLSPLLSPLPSAVYLAIAAIVSGRLGRAQDGGSCCGTTAAAFFLSLSDQQSFKQRSVASSVWRALVATQFSSPRKDPGPSDGPQS
ncbi:hypothetical protein BGZ57DRAFT_632954 [Hyaloscypha finlandica]|nr:hypothetical protein BGZ57DRAFT_632954 [Hyaloscypha finlandica]